MNTISLAPKKLKGSYVDSVAQLSNIAQEHLGLRDRVSLGAHIAKLEEIWFFDSTRRLRSFYERLAVFQTFRGELPQVSGN